MYQISNNWSLHIGSLRIGRRQHAPDSSHHSLYLVKLFTSSYPEGNFGRNQLDGSISLLPLYPSMTHDLHATSLHLGFPRPHPSQAYFTIFRVLMDMLMLKSLPSDRSAADAKKSVITFLAHVGSHIC